MFASDLVFSKLVGKDQTELILLFLKNERKDVMRFAKENGIPVRFYHSLTTLAFNISQYICKNARSSLKSKRV